MIIVKARAACNLDPLDPNGATMRAQVQVWSEVLETVPIEHLNESYLDAIRAHSTSFPLGVGEIVAAYEAMRPSLMRKMFDREEYERDRPQNRATPEEVREIFKALRQGKQGNQ